MNDNQNQHQPAVPLSPQELAYCKTPALLTLARLRGDHKEMDMQLELACEQLSFKQIIGALTTELAAIMQQQHGTAENAERVLVATVERMNQSSTE
ncbi:hypothetical protein [Corynebacterium flavescens]|uniref:hypothetical protein n=1 Tax=Corynebacterium flavescens TaxID=28028 RepID=UPI003FCFFFBD